MKVARSHLAIVRPGEEPWLTVYFPLGLSIHIRTTSISTFVNYLHHASTKLPGAVCGP